MKKLQILFPLFIIFIFVYFTTCDLIQEDANTDTDGDGINDLSDNCDSIYNPDQADWDGDYIGDACDENLTPCGDPTDPNSGPAYNTCDPSITDTQDSSWCNLDGNDSNNDVDGDGDADYICHGRITLESGKKIRYYRNYPLYLSTYQHQTVAIQDDPEAILRYAINRAVIVVHGVNQTAHSYYRNMRSCAKECGTFKNTIIIAPHFISNKHHPADNELHWNNSSPSWTGGANSLNYPHTSSYMVMDEIIEKISHFPNLEEIVLFGHSAGGQFVQRYAAGNQIDGTINVPIRYIVANPSSYMYLNYKRPVSNINGNWSFGIPAPGCPYNVYRYGTDFMQPYMPSKETIRKQYPGRNVTYLIGTEEDDCACEEQPGGQWDGVGSCGEYLDCGCEARWQGRNRYERAHLFYQFMDTYYPDHIHELIEVPGVGHSSGGMMRSNEGKQLLFRVQ